MENEAFKQAAAEKDAFWKDWQLERNRDALAVRKLYDELLKVKADILACDATFGIGLNRDETFIILFKGKKHKQHSRTNKITCSSGTYWAEGGENSRESVRGEVPIVFHEVIGKSTAEAIDTIAKCLVNRSLPADGTYGVVGGLESPFRDLPRWEAVVFFTGLGIVLVAVIWFFSLFAHGPR